jgi:hypothetical protein
MGEKAGEQAGQAPQQRGDENQQHAAPARGLFARHGYISSSMGSKGG